MICYISILFIINLYTTLIKTDNDLLCTYTNTQPTIQTNLQYCKLYNNKQSCCNNNDVTQLQQYIYKYHTSIDIDVKCKKYAASLLCNTKCSNKYITHSMCNTLCDEWYNACHTSMFTYNNVLHSIVPCNENDLLCSKLNTIIHDGSELCQLFNISSNNDNDCIHYDNEQINKIYNKLGSFSSTADKSKLKQSTTQTTSQYDFTMDDIHTGIVNNFRIQYQRYMYMVNKYTKQLLSILGISETHIKTIKFIALVPLLILAAYITQWARYNIGITRRRYNNKSSTSKRITMSDVRQARLNRLNIHNNNNNSNQVH